MRINRNQTLTKPSPLFQPDFFAALDGGVWERLKKCELKEEEERVSGWGISETAVQ